MCEYLDNTLFVHQVVHTSTIKNNLITINNNLNTVTNNLAAYPTATTLSSLVTNLNTISGNLNNTLTLNNVSISGDTTIGTSSSNTLTVNSVPSFYGGIIVPSGAVHVNNLLESGTLYCDQNATISGELKLYNNIDMTARGRIAIPSTATIATEPSLSTNNLGYTLTISSNINIPTITTNGSIYTPTNALSITLPYAGIWNITWSIIVNTSTTSSTLDRIIAMLSSTSATFDYNESAYNNYTSQSFTNGIPFTINGFYTYIGDARTIYLNYNIYQSSFTSGILTTNYKINATRMA